jgi:hypothetical protein
LYESLLGRVPIEYLSADWLLTSFLDSVNLYDLWPCSSAGCSWAAARS